MALLPTGSRVITVMYGNTAPAKSRTKYFPAVIMSPRYPYPDAASIKQLRADAAAVGNPNIKIFAYILMTDIVGANTAICATVRQLLHDNPQYFLLQQGTGLPLGANFTANAPCMARLSRTATDTLLRTYADAYVDLTWADFLSQDGYDGVFVDEYFSTLTPTAVWNARTTGTITSATPTSLTTSGTPSLLGLDARIGRFTSGALSGKFFFTNQSGSTQYTVGLSMTLGGTASPVTPAVNDTFEIVTSLTQITPAVAVGGMAADLYGDQRQANLGSAQANDEILYVQQAALRRLDALAAAAGKPNFTIIYNVGAGAGRYAYTREMVADGVLNGILFEGFHGSIPFVDPLCSVSLANEVCNTLPTKSAGGYPSLYVTVANDTDYLKMRNGYALAMMTDGWSVSHTFFNNVVADEFLVDLSVPIDPPQITPQPGGYFLRRYVGGATIYNPSLATISNISIPGYKLFNSLLPPYAGQDTTFNNGASTVTLPTLCGAILVPA